MYGSGMGFLEVMWDSANHPNISNEKIFFKAGAVLPV